MSDAVKPKPKLSITTTLLHVGQILERYVTLGFVLLLLLVYGFVLYRIQAAQSTQPSDSDITAQLQTTTTPHVDPAAAAQLQSLQDHSVNVKTLFDQARSNPFQE